MESKQLLSPLICSLITKLQMNYNMEGKAVNFQILSSVKSILVWIHNQIVVFPSSDFCTNYDFY